MNKREKICYWVSSFCVLNFLCWSTNVYSRDERDRNMDSSCSNARWLVIEKDVAHIVFSTNKHLELFNAINECYEYGKDTSRCMMIKRLTKLVVDRAIAISPYAITDQEALHKIFKHILGDKRILVLVVEGKLFASEDDIHSNTIHDSLKKLVETVDGTKLSKERHDKITKEFFKRLSDNAENDNPIKKAYDAKKYAEKSAGLTLSERVKRSWALLSGME